jgi:DNA relaxase NicK
MRATVSIDWLSFTVRCDAREDEGRGEAHSSDYGDVLYIIEGILKLDPEQFQPMLGGRYGYRKGVSFNGIEVYYDGNSTTMGANVSMSGEGCKTYCQHHKMEELLARVHELTVEGEVNPTRIDVACDDYEGNLDIGLVREHLDSDKWRSRLENYDDRKSRKRGEARVSYSIYIGSEMSEMRFRIYDKVAEQKAKGIECPHAVWNRIEMVNRRDYARAVLDALVTSETEIGETVAGIIVGRIAFIERDNSKIERCSLAPWWAEFIGEVKKVKLMLKEKPEMAIERLERYFGEELAGCVYMLDKVLGDSFWKNVKKHGKTKLRERHLKILEQHTGELPGQLQLE